MEKEKWSGLEDKAFGFIKIPPRSIKPRDRGINVVADKGLGLNQLEDLCELAGDYIDWLKIGISAPRIYSRQHLIDKIKICHKHNVKAFFAGDVTEMAYMQGVIGQYFQEALDLGGDGVEISTAQVYMDLAEKGSLVGKAVKTGLKVFAEVGKKGLGGWSVPTNYINKEIQTLKDAGAYKIVIQGEGVVEDVKEINEKPLFEIAAKFDIHDFIFQAKDNRAHAWLIKNFGPEVSMDIESNQVVNVELCRRGIRSRGLFGLICSVKD
jgi:phosphosulfolactate synthase